jgi:hypothetical protein
VKRLLNVLAITLALNFLVAAGGIGWLWKSGKLDRDKAHEIREIVFPSSMPTTQEVKAVLAEGGATTKPMMRLEELLEKEAGRPASEQVAYMQASFDAQMAQMDRRQRELGDLQRQVEIAQGQLTKDRTALEAEKKSLAAREDETARLQADKGFQDSLELYKSMQPKQVKEIFMKLDDGAVERYLTAMEPRAAGKIIKEFKTPEEIQHVQAVLEKIRQAQQQQADTSAKG